MKVINLFSILLFLTILIPTTFSFIFDLLSFAFVIISFLLLLTKPYYFKKPKITKPLISLLIFSFIVLISFLVNGFEQSIISTQKIYNFKLSLIGLFTVFIFTSTFFIISSLKLTEIQKVRILFYFTVAGSINAIITIIHWITVTGGVIERYNYFPPISGSNGIQIYFMIFTFFTGITLLKLKISQTRKLYVKIAISLCLINMLSILVREAWIIFIFSLIILWLLTTKRSKFSKYLIGIFIVAISIFSIYTILSSLDILSDIISINSEGSSASTIIRILMIQDSIELFLSNPFFGVGFGNFSFHSDLYVNLSGGNIERVNSPHNALLLIACELGVLGILSFFILCFNILLKLYKNIRIEVTSFNKVLSTVLFPLILLLTIDQIISNSVFLPPPVERSSVQLAYVFWILVSLCFNENSKNEIKND